MAESSMSNSQRMKNVDPRKLAVLLDLVKESEGKSMEQLLPLLMSTNKRLSDENLTFNKEESEIMMDILTKNMSSKEKTQFDMIRKMMSKK